MAPKYAQRKRLISVKDCRIQRVEPPKKEEEVITRVKPISASMFFQHNSALGPPYRVLIDTNFINFTITNKLDLVKNMMDCLLAKCTPCITDCVLAELEKLGVKYRLALKVARDKRIEVLPCIHKGTYADDCIVNRVTQHRIYIVATCDKGLKRRLREIPGVPIMYVARHKYAIERLPETNSWT